ncbi:MAG: thiamine-monophosphate kinase [Kiritimatiellae bacterium]|nr:thiamine-monophosphate kinase [Kiritimatiellia bacterium]
MLTLQELGELALVERITQWLPGDSRVITGPGDDCAVVRGHTDAQLDWVLTSDPLVQGIHFADDATARAIGHKAVGRVLSDLAAMGAKPAWGLVNLVAPGSTNAEVVDDIYNGMTSLASKHGFLIVGGDVAQGSVVELHAFGIGELPRGSAVLRSGATIGDVLFVTGALGGSQAENHLCFDPRVQQGQWLRNWATAMIDVSDGLAGDLRHLCDMSKTGCDLNASAIPVSLAAKKLDDGTPPLDHALHDGEDFELLFTIPEDNLNLFTEAWAKAFPNLTCSMIGIMTEQTGLIRCIFPDGESVALEHGGYQHFNTH